MLSCLFYVVWILLYTTIIVIDAKQLSDGKIGIERAHLSKGTIIVNKSEAADTTVSAQWHVEHPGDLRAGRYSYSVPHKRYGASMVAVGDHSLVLLYGYNYDHARRRPVWLDDVWAFHPSPPLSRFNLSFRSRSTTVAKAADSKSQPSSNRRTSSVPDNSKDVVAYERPVTKAHFFSDGFERRKFQNGLWRRKATSGNAPPPGYKHMAVCVHELIVLFGGDDGGLSRDSKTFQWGSFFADLYVLSVNSWRWRRVSQVGAPAARQGGTMTVVGDLVILFGGMISSESEEASWSSPGGYYPALNLRRGDDVQGPRKALFEAMAAGGGRIGGKAYVDRKRNSASSADNGKKGKASSIVESNAVYILPVSDLQGRPKRVTWHRCEVPSFPPNQNLDDGDAQKGRVPVQQQLRININAPWPTPRRAHGAAAYNGALYIFGGFTSAFTRPNDSSESNHSAANSRRELLESAVLDNGGEQLLTPPPKRHIDFHKGGDSKAQLAAARNLNDVWKLKVLPSSSILGDGYECHWEQLWPRAKSKPERKVKHPLQSSKGASSSASVDLETSHEDSPTGRGGMAMTVVSLPSDVSSSSSSSSIRSSSAHLLVSNGAQCSGGCKCLADTWAFSLNTEQWKQLSTHPRQTPIGRYFVSAATLRDRLFVFGGESYAPYAYWNDMWSLEIAKTSTPDVVSNPLANKEEPDLRKRPVAKFITNDSVDYSLLYSASHGGSVSAGPVDEAALVLYTNHLGLNYTNLMLRTRDNEEDKVSKGSRGYFWSGARKAVDKSIANDAEEDAFYSSRLSEFSDEGVEDHLPSSLQRYYAKYYNSPDALLMGNNAMLGYDDSDPLMEGSYFGGYESVEVPHPLLTVVFVLPLSLGLTAVGGFCLVTRRKMKLWRKQNK